MPIDPLSSLSEKSKNSGLPIPIANLPGVPGKYTAAQQLELNKLKINQCVLTNMRWSIEEDKKRLEQKLADKIERKERDPIKKELSTVKAEIRKLDKDLHSIQDKITYLENL